MILILVLAGCICLVNGGVSIWSPELEKRALYLYQEICLNGDRGIVGGTSVFCKRSNIPSVVINRNHSVSINTPSTLSKQIVFLRPQSNKYEHTVILRGKTEHKHNTTIYVVPQSDQHSIDILDQRETAIVPQKPQLYYLKSDPSAVSSVVDDQPIQVSPPPPTLPKTNPIFDNYYYFHSPKHSEKTNFYLPPKLLRSNEQRRVHRQAGGENVKRQMYNKIILVSPSYTSARKQGYPAKNISM